MEAQGRSMAVSNPMNDAGPETARSEEPRGELEDDQQRRNAKDQVPRLIQVAPVLSVGHQRGRHTSSLVHTTDVRGCLLA